jgi:hypothetical protein
MTDVFDDIRRACALVAERAVWVRIDHERLASYAADIADDVLFVDENDPGRERFEDLETTVSFVVSLDAVNFGSGYFPFLRKRPGMSGYHTIASALREHVARQGAIDVDTLRAMTPDRCAALFGQDLDDGPAGELMTLFATALHDLGGAIAERHDGSFTTLLASCEHRAGALVLELDRIPFFHDVARYGGLDVPLYKRAQITANDLTLALAGSEHADLARFDDIDRLTMFPDNLVPHVLRVDGVLVFAPELLDRIERVDDITSGSEPEVEIRAVSLHAVELLSEALRAAGTPAHARDLDTFLWNRGAGGVYKAVPRHRTRCVYY